jgi:transposase
VLRALERGERPSDIARRFEVSRNWVNQVRNRFLHDGERSSRQIGGHRRSRIAHLEETIRGWIEVQSDLTLAQLCERLNEHGIEIKSPGLWHQINKWNLSYKKNDARQRARTSGRETSSS